MQGLVTIDFGNTNPTAGIFQKTQGHWDLIKVVKWNELALYLTQFKMDPNNTAFVLSEVKDRENELLPYMQQGYLLTRVKDFWRGNRFAGMPVNYANTLGEDRLIESYFTFKKEKQNTLIIDAGTFVTMDVITKEGFLGGYIIPGVENYYKTYTQGELLKNIELELKFSDLLPQTTQAAMSESYSAFAFLAKELISKYQIQKVILTGGWGYLWKNFLFTKDESLVVESSPDLIHWALQYWMTTQIEVQ